MKMPKPPPQANSPKKKPQASYEQFEASALFCPRCRQAVPVRKRLLLILPDGDKYEYLCAYCSYSLGTKMEYETKEVRLLV
jgi:hypothetical protein